MSVAATKRRAPGLTSVWAERVVAAYPLLLAYVVASLVYEWQAWLHPTAWFFYDELLYTELSRSIAETGHAALRGHPASFTTLYAFLLAPAWRIRGSASAYEAAKLLGVLTMSSVVFPVYGLARTLVSPRAAVFAAAASAAIPSMAYSSLLLTEVLAYPFAALCFFLALRALVTRRSGWILGAVATSLVAPLVRSQLIVVPVAVALAALAVAATDGRFFAWLRAAPRAVWIGLALAAAAACIVGDRVIGHFYGIWTISIHEHPGRVLEYGIWSLGALTIGLGVLPVVAGLASLVPDRGRDWTTSERAFAALTGSSVFAFALYTGVKTAYLASFWQKHVEERNVIYLSPLVLTATAIWLERRRVRLPALVAAAALVVVLLARTPLTFDYPNIEALGLSLSAWANLHLGITSHFARVALLAFAAGSVLAVVAAGLRPNAVATRACVTVLGALLIGWNLAGELAASDFSRGFSHLLRDSVPQPLDWVDRATAGANTALLVHQVGDANAIHELEFWNRSIVTVANVDGVGYPGPGPVFAVTPQPRDGKLLPDPGARYAVAESGVDPVGTLVEAHPPWTLVELSGPLRLADARSGVEPDGWTGRTSAYTQYSTPGNLAGTLTIYASRTGWCGAPVGGDVVVRLGRLVTDPSGNAHLAPGVTRRTKPIRSCGQAVFRLRTPRPPFRAELVSTRTFVPTELDPRLSDRRRLGAQVTFGFTARPAPRGSPGAAPAPPARQPPTARPRAGARARG